METIQRGDQVYYRGRVWTVTSVPHNFKPATYIRAEYQASDGSVARAAIPLDKIQRVEQVR